MSENRNFGKLYKYLDKFCEGPDGTKNYYYNIKDVMTYGLPVNVVTGVRRVGKTMSLAASCIFDYIVLKHKFLYVRRYDKQTRSTAKKYFLKPLNEINKKFGWNLSLKLGKDSTFLLGIPKGGTIEEGEDPYNWEPCGFCKSLSNEEDDKSGGYDGENIRIGIFDEFISKDDRKYLGTLDNPGAEWDAVMSLFESIDRGQKQFTMFFMGNKATIFNPICISLGISDYLTKGQRYTHPKNSLWVWRDIRSGEIPFMAKYKEDESYLLSSYKTKKYAFEGESSEDSEEFIKKPKQYIYKCTLVKNRERYGLYRGINKEMGNYYIWKPQDNGKIISIDEDSHTEGDLYNYTKWRESPILESLRESYKKGRLFFQDGKTRKIFLDYLQFTI